MDTMETKPAPYMNPYLAGIGLGLVLLAAFVISGRGLGASGAIMRTVVKAEKVVAQGHVDSNEYLSTYGGGDTDPWDEWLVLETLGVIIGGLISGAAGRRIRKEINHGPRISPARRLVFATAGGAFFGYGARLARGCTSGVALTGGATLAVGSWITMLCIFAGAYALAWALRRLWI